MSRDPVQQVSAAGRRALALGFALATLALAAPSARAFSIEPFRGHLAIGYAKLFVSDAPGGSLSVQAGIDHPLVRGARLGLDFGYHLLGSRNVESGSLAAGLDYSAFTTALLVHWVPNHLGPVGRLSLGPALVNAHVDLSTSGGGAAFAPYAVDETAPGVAFAATIISKREMPVRTGLELGATLGFLEQETWTLASARLVFHY
jgi:hypothetical protein